MKKTERSKASPKRPAARGKPAPAASKRTKATKAPKTPAAAAPPGKVAAARVTVSQHACNICGGTRFVPGPGGRMSITKRAPVCEGCGSFERHRAFRSIFDKIRSPAYKKLSCLSFNKDRSIAGGWFKTARYGDPATDPLDVQSLDLPDESVDVVVCNHVLNSVPDYKQGLAELTRIVSRTGYIFLSFANPHYRKITEDWGYPKPKQHGHYRVFGADIEKKLPVLTGNLGVARVIGEDPVTGVEERAYIISKNEELLMQIGERGVRIRFLHF
jgi:hypothetical protein